jgi:hypothetical protein
MKKKKPMRDIHVRIPPELLEAIEELADLHARSVNMEIVWLLGDAVKNEQKKQG